MVRCGSFLPSCSKSFEFLYEQATTKYRTRTYHRRSLRIHAVVTGGWWTWLVTLTAPTSCYMEVGRQVHVFFAIAFRVCAPAGQKDRSGVLFVACARHLACMTMHTQRCRVRMSARLERPVFRSEQSTECV